MKKIRTFLFLFSTLLYFCNIRACMDHTSDLMIVLFQGEICSVVLNTDTVTSSISPEHAAQLVGTGTTQYWLGSLTFFLFTNEPTNPHTVELISTTYDAVNQTYYADNGTDRVVFGIKRNFDDDGNTTPFTTLTPTTNPIVVRTGSGMILEDHVFRFYIFEDPSNVFSDGQYVANFRIYFTSP